MPDGTSVLDDGGDDLPATQGQHDPGSDLGPIALGSSRLHPVSLSPWRLADHGDEVGLYGPVEGTRQTIAGASPTPDRAKVERWGATNFRPVLVSDGISPPV